ncbi:hypothetical protein [Nesterenkonia pannonica]|uniref:hypothetical protein n=1 Tax=Nesterenkonia pannonica TaxID=1548602 RepID=UPI002164BB1F|nr:hypothetical protein [Nesterenkonia pannonica]
MIPALSDDEAGAAVRSALESLGPDGRAQVLAAVARRFSDLDLAEELVQEAMVQALRTWGAMGCPKCLRRGSSRRPSDEESTHCAASRRRHG